jgi:cytochrome P450
MSPSVGSSLLREVEAGGAVIDGDFIPPGYNVGTPIYAIHHNSAYFPDPFKFAPERWIVGEGQTTRESVDLALKAYIPFSYGPRSCLGKGMALTELLLTMATILWRLDFKVAEGDISGGHPSAVLGRHRPWEFQLQDHVTSANRGPLLHFRERRV